MCLNWLILLPLETANKIFGKQWRRNVIAAGIKLALQGFQFNLNALPNHMKFILKKKKKIKLSNLFIIIIFLIREGSFSKIGLWTRL